MFAVDDGQYPNPNFNYACQNPANLDFSVANISKILHKIHKKSSAGPDSIPSFFRYKLSYSFHTLYTSYSHYLSGKHYDHIDVLLGNSLSQVELLFQQA